MGSGPTLVKPTASIYVGALDVIQEGSFDSLVVCSNNHPSNISEKAPGHGPKTLYLVCPSGKLGSRALRQQLHLLPSFLKPFISSQDRCNILFTCPSGNDLAVGAALVALCLFFLADGQSTQTHFQVRLFGPIIKLETGSIKHEKDQNGPELIDKTFIRQRLTWITTSKPDANPSRATLLAVNSFLLKETRSNSMNTA